jgi:hypothetical protein
LNKWIEKNKSKYDYDIIYSQDDDGKATYIIEYRKLRSVY